MTRVPRVHALALIMFATGLCAAKDLTPSRRLPRPSVGPQYQFDPHTLLIVTHAFGFREAQLEAAYDLIRSTLEAGGRVFVNYEADEDRDFKDCLEETHPAFIASGHLTLNRSSIGKMGDAETDYAEELTELGERLQLSKESKIYLIGNALECCLSASLSFTLGAVHFRNLDPAPALHVDLDMANHIANRLFRTDGTLALEEYTEIIRRDFRFFIEKWDEDPKKTLLDTVVQSFDRSGNLIGQANSGENPAPDYVVKLFYSQRGR